MLNTYLRSLKSVCKKFAKQHNIFDVVLYGSAVKGKEEARDIDLLLIFNDRRLKERTEIAHELKKSLKHMNKIDIKTINISEMFEQDFLARQGIFIEGYSLLYGEEFPKRAGFSGKVIFSYNLKNLNHNEKTKFMYALIGRKQGKSKQKESIRKKLEIEHLGKGVLMVPIKNSLVLQDFLDKWKINYKKKNILVSLI